MFALPKWWWEEHKSDILFFSMIVLLIVGVVGSSWSRHSVQRNCMKAGYARYESGFCVRQVKGTDEMIPYAEVAK